MFPPNMDFVDRGQDTAMDRWIRQQFQEAQRLLPDDLEVLPSPLLLQQMEREATQRRDSPTGGLPLPQSAYDGSRLPIRCPRTGLLGHCSSSPLLHPAAEPTFSSHRKKRRHGVASCFSVSEEEVLMPTAAAVFPMPSSATPMENQLRMNARKIKLFRRTILRHPSPELKEKTGAAAQPTSCLQSGAAVLSTACLLSAADGSIATTSARRRLRRKHASLAPVNGGPAGAPAPGPINGGPADTLAPAHATEGLSDASAHAHPTEGLCDASTAAHTTEGLGDTSGPAPVSEGLGDASACPHATEGRPDAPAPVFAVGQLDVPAPTSVFTGGQLDASVPATVFTGGQLDALAPASVFTGGHLDASAPAPGPPSEAPSAHSGWVFVWV
ncbi:hypothetical protein CRENBAI_010867 [Crenichthys baileyi]|uniref:Uncharacterized protein n=1 Tax=Crenichthys baileyi TaxID=28760 RepID=A0AAV9QVQ1_9TELE